MFWYSFLPPLFPMHATGHGEAASVARDVDVNVSQVLSGQGSLTIRRFLGLGKPTNFCFSNLTRSKNELTPSNDLIFSLPVWVREGIKAKNTYNVIMELRVIMENDDIHKDTYKLKKNQQNSA